MAERTELASLSASCVAASISLLIATGAYDHMSVVVSVTLLVVIAASFDPKPHRPTTERVAIACAIALASLPLTGFLFELWQLGPHAVSYLLGDMDVCRAQGRGGVIYTCNGDGTPQSEVGPLAQLIAWLVISVFLTFAPVGISRKTAATASR